MIAFLSSFLTVAYVLCGLIAWSRRPASRFGPLMVAAGVANFLTGLSWTTSDVPFTIGQSFDLVPPVLFLHVFLAYPSGRLRSRSERILVAAAYGTAIVLQLVRMALGGFGPHNLIEVSPDPGAGLAVLRVQLVAVSAFCLCGLGILVARRLPGGPAAATLAGTAHRRVRARARDDSVPARLSRVRRSDGGGDPVGDLSHPRACAGRLPDRAAA